MKEKKGRKGWIAIVVVCAIALILLVILAINLTLIIKGSLNKDVPPDIFGVAPLAVTSGSMDGEAEDSFGEGALIFVKLLSDEQKDGLEEGDIVTFRTDDGIYVTHRIISISRGVDGKIVSLHTKGDANLSSDGETAVSSVVGICTGSVAGLGGFALFLQTPAGIAVFVGIPVAAFIVFDAVRIFVYNRKIKEEGVSDKAMRDKDEEIVRLRAIIDGKQFLQSAEDGEEQSCEQSVQPSDDEKMNSADD